MPENILDPASSLRATGWRQGDLIAPDQVSTIIGASIDHCAVTESPDIWLVVLTQDCDLVRATRDEPYVEMLAIQKLPCEPEYPLRGQSARNLHLEVSTVDQIHWFACTIHNRFRIPKAALLDVTRGGSLELPGDQRRNLRKWVARRYTREPFPDYFEGHLAPTKGRVKSLFKSEAAKLISTVYIAIDNENADLTEDYFIHSILAARAMDLADDVKRQRIDDFEERFREVFNSRPHIRWALKNPDDPESGEDIRVLAEEDINLAMIRRFKRFDADYRSIDDDVITPPDGIDDY